MKKIYFAFLLCFSLVAQSQEIALLKYNGGGDWYGNPTSLPNLIKFCNQNINTRITPKPATVEPGSPDLLSYPFVHMTGHGNVVFSDSEINNLRNYLTSGGFPQERCLEKFFSVLCGYIHPFHSCHLHGEIHRK
ncbi:MAG: DUF4159 domain-containing protein [Flavobacterium sp.]|nr:DUF4159 domain-containing protein [Flavobacterium sp.]